jgi:very-short-patch-repair endonuclease
MGSEAVTPLTPPSSGPADHLLPQGEKEGGHFASSSISPNTAFPSPLAGEGARRVGEGERATEIPPAARLHKSAPRQTGFARSMRHQPTEAEEQLWRLLKDRRLVGYKFRRQVPIGPFIADFACYSARLVIELDGSQHADDPGDKKRDAWFTADGFRTLRIWNNDLTTKRESVLQAIWHALTAAAP